MAKKKKFYAVAVGRTTGIYESWSECEKQVRTDVVSYCSRMIAIQQFSLVITMKYIIVGPAFFLY